MATSKARRRQQQLKGLLPVLGHGLARLGGWIIRHPQPMIVSSVMGISLWATASFIQQSDAFQITALTIPANLELKLPSTLVGQNIWQVNLRGLSEQLQRQRPDLKEIRVIRQLPGSLRVNAIARIPVAQLRLDRWYRVDRDGFILPQGTAVPQERLVRFSGLTYSEGSLKAGRANTDERLKLALRVLDTLRQAPTPVSHRVVEINVADSQQIRFVLDDELEIRCGTEAELAAHLARLQATLKMLAKQPSMPIRYIDVRFEEPVVGPQT